MQPNRSLLRSRSAASVGALLAVLAASCATERPISDAPANPVSTVTVSTSSPPAPPAPPDPTPQPASAARGELHARPSAPRAPLAFDGRIPLHLGARRDGFLWSPPGTPPDRPLPLVVFFHGAGGNAGQADMLLARAAQQGARVLSVDSRGATWDLIEDELGPDVAFVDRALAWTFERVAVDPAHVVAAGFSDGASYALSLGLANGGLFTDVVAFSPGFEAAPARRGSPRVFVSHGRSDGVLPIDACTRRIVPRLTRAGYAVELREFDGPHTVPPAIVDAAFAWLRSSART